MPDRQGTTIFAKALKGFFRKDRLSRFSNSKSTGVFALLTLLLAGLLATSPVSANKMASFAGSDSLNSIVGGQEVRIIGGTPSSAEHLPFMLALYQGRNAASANFVCGASLIGEYWAMTAAHCATSVLNGRPINANRLFIRVGVSKTERH